MSTQPVSAGFLGRWGTGPLVIYAIGILLPVLTALSRVDLMPFLGLPVYTILFWMGPFAGAAAVFWSGWSAVWRTVWVVLVPVFIAITFLPLMI